MRDAWNGSVAPDNAEWRRIELPFQWARDLLIYVAFSPRSPTTIWEVILADRRDHKVMRIGGAMKLDARTTYLRWDVPLEPDAFDVMYRPMKQPQLLRGPKGKHNPHLMMYHELCEAQLAHEHAGKLDKEHTQDEIHGRGKWPDDDPFFGHPNNGNGGGNGNGNGNGGGNANGNNGLGNGQN